MQIFARDVQCPAQTRVEGLADFDVAEAPAAVVSIGRTQPERSPSRSMYSSIIRMCSVLRSSGAHGRESRERGVRRAQRTSAGTAERHQSTRAARAFEAHHLVCGKVAGDFRRRKTLTGIGLVELGCVHAIEPDEFAARE